MKVLCATTRVSNIRLAVCLVPPELCNESYGKPLIKRLQGVYRDLPIMLVTVVSNGFRSFATFQTAELLALLQLEKLRFVEVDLSRQPLNDEDPPF